MSESPFDQRGQEVVHQYHEYPNQSRLVAACEELVREYRFNFDEMMPLNIRTCIEKIEKLVRT